MGPGVVMAPGLSFFVEPQYRHPCKGQVTRWPLSSRKRCRRGRKRERGTFRWICMLRCEWEWHINPVNWVYFIFVISCATSTKIKLISKDQRSKIKSEFQIGEEKVLGEGSLASVWTPDDFDLPFAVATDLDKIARSCRASDRVRWQIRSPFSAT